MKKGLYCTLLAIVLTAAVFLLPILNSGLHQESHSSDADKSQFRIVDKTEEQSSQPDIAIPASDETVTFLVFAQGESFSETVLSSGGKYSNMKSFIHSADFRQYADQMKKTQAVIKASISKIIPEASFDSCFTYNTIANGFSVRAPYSCRSKISRISGVAAVVLSSEQHAVICDNDEETTEKTSQEEPKKAALTGGMSADVSQFYAAGITGAGRLIAVLDDGFNCSDASFSGSVKDSVMDQKTVQNMISDAGFNTAAGAEVYKSEKIIFAYDYAGRDEDTFCSSHSHGTKIAGICAGTETGIARDSSLVLMKVCRDHERKISDDVLLAALDDAAKLSPDLINLSFGTPRVTSNAAVFDVLYSRLSELGSYIVSAAGNYSANLRYDSENGIGSGYTDYSTIAFPSSLNCVTSVGAVNGAGDYLLYAAAAEDKLIPYKLLSYTSDISLDFAGLGAVEYEYVPSVDDSTDLAEIELTGKIAVFGSSDHDFSELIKMAADKGAAGVLIMTSEKLYYEFSADESGIPAAVIADSYGEYFTSEPSGNLTFSEDAGYFANPDQNIPASFTSYGVTSDLRLKPDIMAPGTDIETSAGTVTGTSASAAVLSGIAALTDEYAASLTDAAVSKGVLIKALMMNTAAAEKYDDSLYYTPRLQGAGRVDADRIMTAGSVILSADGQPSASIGDSPEGHFDFTVTVSSLAAEPITYTLSAQLQTDHFEGTGGDIRNLLIPESLSASAVTEFRYLGESVSSITLEPGEVKELEVSLTLSDEAILAYMQLAPNGFYVDGYIFLNGQDNQSIHMPLMGYCGSWNAVDMFDASVYESGQTAVIDASSLTAVGSLGSSYPDYKLGRNMTSNVYSSDHISIGRNTVKNYYDNALVGNAFMLPDFYLLRDASDYTISVSDSSGTQIFEQAVGTVSAFASGSYDPYMGLLGSFNPDNIKNFFAQLPEGKYTYSVSAVPVSAQSTGSSRQTVSYDFTVDNTSPGDVRAKVYAENSKAYLELSAKDKNGIQGFRMFTACRSGERYFYADNLSDLIEGEYISADACRLVRVSEESDSTVFLYDITELKHQLSRLGIYTRSGVSERPTSEKIFIRAVDYAYNLSGAMICDTQPSGTVTYQLKDQDGLPVENVRMMLGNQTAVSSENGIVTFEGIVPDTYGVSVLSMPEGCTSDFSVDIVQIGLDSMDYTLDVVIHRTEQAKQLALEEKERQEKAQQLSVKPDKTERSQNTAQQEDNSVTALIFVSVILFISAGSLLLAERRKKSWLEEETDNDS